MYYYVITRTLILFYSITRNLSRYYVYLYSAARRLKLLAKTNIFVMLLSIVCLIMIKLRLNAMDLNKRSQPKEPMCNNAESKLIISGGFKMIVKKLSLGILGTNCYILYDDEKNALIIDPGSEAEVIKKVIQDENLNPKAILLTHAHFDHIGAVDTIRKDYGIDVYIHEREAGWLNDPNLNRSALSLGDPILTDPPEKLVHTGRMQLSAFTFDVLHTPGHSPGSVSYVFNNHHFIISGDVLFQRGVGRTDLPEGSMQELQNSIRQKLYQLPDHYTVYPGHGDPTTIGDEKQLNPFVPEV